jgi:hypothetical protein
MHVHPVSNIDRDAAERSVMAAERGGTVATVDQAPTARRDDPARHAVPAAA